MSRRRRRKWPWMLVLLAVLGGGGWWYWRQQGQKTTGPEYETAKVERGDIVKTVRATGALNPLVMVEIGSQISGTISELFVDFNSKVKAGDVLCRLDPATYEANLKQSIAQRNSARAEYELQKATLERKRQLLEKNFFAQADYDVAVANLKRAEAQLELTEAQLNKVEVDLERCTIVAPMDGIIIDRTAEVGQTIAASFNAPKLFVLANDLTKMQINARVSEADIGQIKEGQHVKFRVDAYNEEFRGDVVQVRNAAVTEENVVNYDAIISVDNPDLKLKPGMNTTSNIIVGEVKNVLKVPNAALRFKPRSASESGGAPREGGFGAGGGGGGEGRRRPGGPGNGEKAEENDIREVYLPPTTPGGEAIPHKIKVGLSDGVYTEVLEGLSEGQEVVVLQKGLTTQVQTEQRNPFGGGMGPGGRRR